MALITCPECNKQVSDKAVSCPGCGCPVAIAYNGKFKLSRLYPLLVMLIIILGSIKLYPALHSFWARPADIKLNVISVNNKMGFINNKGEVVIPPKYEYVSGFSEGLCGVKLNGKSGYIDLNDKMIFSIDFDYTDGFTEGLAPITINGKFGYINRKGEAVTKIVYEQVSPFNDGIALVESSGGQKHYINKKGQIVINTNDKYTLDNMNNSDEHFYSSHKDGFISVMDATTKKKGFVDKTGKVIIPCKYDEVDDFYEAYAAVCLNGKYGFINKAGDIAIDAKYDEVTNFSEGIASVKINGKYGAIDKHDKMLIEPKYYSSIYFKNGMARVATGLEEVGKNHAGTLVRYKDYICIDNTGKKIDLCDEYIDRSSFKNGIAAVSKNNKLGFIDKSGKVMVMTNYDYYYNGDFDGEIAAFKQKDGSKGYVNTKGKIIWPLTGKI